MIYIYIIASDFNPLMKIEEILSRGGEGGEHEVLPKVKLGLQYNFTSGEYVECGTGRAKGTF